MYIERANRMIGHRHIVMGVLLLSAAWLAGCDAADSGAAGGRPRVVATTTMIADLAQQIGGDRIALTGIMKVGEDPHVYDVRPRDAQSIAVADLVLMNGLHLEATLLDVVENNARGAVVKLAESPRIAPLGSTQYQGAPDPHCWFNVQHYKVYAEGVRDALIAADPDHAAAYEASAAAYLAQLDELDAWITQQLDTIPRERRVMVTSHDAFQYLGERYGIDVLAIVGISTEQAPRPQDIQRIESMIRERNVKALFLETSVAQTLNALIEKVSAETGAKVGGTLYSDSLGPPPPESEAGTYIGMFRHNITTIVDALK